MKFKNYVAIISYPDRIQYVTEVDNATKTAKWSPEKPAKPFGATAAKDLVWALRCNAYDAAVITLPDFEEPRNPAKEDWFGVTRWCDDDIREALQERGYLPTKEAIALIRKESDRGLNEAAIEEGWNIIDWHIDCNKSHLVERKSPYKNAVEVAKEIGSVFGQFRHDAVADEYIIEYDGTTYRYRTFEELLFDWEDTIRAQHEDSNGADGANWEDELQFIEELRLCQ